MTEPKEISGHLFIDFENVRQFSAFDKFYAVHENQHLPIYSFPATQDGLEEAIQERSKFPIDRELLVSVLQRQYASAGIDSQDDLIKALRHENSYTITCAHQPNLFTGPAYFIYKLLSTIKLAEQCQKSFTDYKFIPVLYLGGEDHDLAECNHIHLFGKRLEWSTNQTGAIGRMLCDDIADVLKELSGILGDSQNAIELKNIITASYATGRTINEAILLFLHHILPEFSFLVFNPDDADIKRQFIPWMKRDILGNESKALVEAGQKELHQSGINAQAYVREINFFYLYEGKRERIVRQDEHFEVIGTDKSWDTQSLNDEIAQHPERFSPNVIMRPVLQEQILPSIAFVGGGGEIAYWSDRRMLFAAYQTFFPVLVRRDSFIIVDGTTKKKMDKLQLAINDLLVNEEELKLRFIQSHTDESINLNQERATINELTKTITDKAVSIDQTLKGFVGAEMNQFNKILSQIEGRILRTLKEKNETALQQAVNIQSKLFPGNSLQERHENFMTWYIRMGNDFFHAIYTACDPMDIRMKVIQIQ